MNELPDYMGQIEQVSKLFGLVEKKDDKGPVRYYAGGLFVPTQEVVNGELYWSVNPYNRPALYVFVKVEQLAGGVWEPTFGVWSVDDDGWTAFARPVEDAAEAIRVAKVATEFLREHSPMLPSMMEFSVFAHENGWHINN